MKDPVKDMKWAKHPIGDVTQWHGENPALYSHMSLNGHNGIDIVRPHGEHIFSVSDGVVCDFKDAPDGYGRYLRILEDMGNGGYREWTYGHFHRMNVKLGDKIAEGQYIGDMGNTGFVVSGKTGFWKTNPYKGTHLHLGLRRVYKSSTGWDYPMGGVKVRVTDYQNGYKGAVDLLPLFNPRHLKSSKIISYASAIGSLVLYQAGRIMKTIGL